MPEPFGPRNRDQSGGPAAKGDELVTHTAAIALRKATVLHRRPVEVGTMSEVYVPPVVGQRAQDPDPDLGVVESGTTTVASRALP
jgi:hypothetical protein